MIKINTLTEQQINNVPIRNINLGVRIINILINENINTLENLKDYVLKNGMFGIIRLPNCGTVSQNKIRKLLQHSYPNINFNEFINEEIYVFEED